MTRALGAAAPVVRPLVWFRGKDLRGVDLAPLAEAARADELIPLFVLDRVVGYRWAEPIGKERDRRFERRSLRCPSTSTRGRPS